MSETSEEWHQSHCRVLTCVRGHHDVLWAIGVGSTVDHCNVLYAWLLLWADEREKDVEDCTERKGLEREAPAPPGSRDGTPEAIEALGTAVESERGLRSCHRTFCRSNYIESNK